jgi:acyl carrier protein
MGLESVEIILSVEEVFDLEIPDEDVEKFETVGDMYLYLLKRLNIPLYDTETGTASWQREQVWQKLRDIFVRCLEIKPEKVTLTARLVHDLGIDA